MTEILSRTRDPARPWIEKPGSLERIITDLGRETLDPVFEEYGRFCDPHPEWLTEAGAKKYAGCTRFWGNFIGRAGLFDVLTDDATVIAQLSDAIARNMATAEYAEARRECAEKAAERRAEMEREHQHRIRLSEAIHG